MLYSIAGALLIPEAEGPELTTLARWAIVLRVLKRCVESTTAGCVLAVLYTGVEALE
jgi:hypothetical protein